MKQFLEQSDSKAFTTPRQTAKSISENQKSHINTNNDLQGHASIKTGRTLTASAMSNHSPYYNRTMLVIINLRKYQWQSIYMKERQTNGIGFRKSHAL